MGEGRKGGRERVGDGRKRKERGMNKGDGGEKREGRGKEREAKEGKRRGRKEMEKKGGRAGWKDRGER